MSAAVVRVSGLDVVVVAGSAEPTRTRVLAALAAQRRPAASVAVVEPAGAAVAEVVAAAAAHAGSAAPWTLLLDEGDVPHPALLAGLEGALDAVAGPAAVLVAAAGPRHWRRPLWRRGHGDAALAAVANALDASGGGDVPTVALDAALLALGAAASHDAAAERVPADHSDTEHGAAEPLPTLPVPVEWLAPLGSVRTIPNGLSVAGMAEGPARRARPAPVAIAVRSVDDWRGATTLLAPPDAGWVAYVDAPALPVVAAAGLEEKARLRIDAGAGAIALLAAPDGVAQPQWQRVEPLPGDTVRPLGVIVPSGAARRALAAHARPAEVWSALVASAGAAGELGAVAHRFRLPAGPASAGFDAVWPEPLAVPPAGPAEAAASAGPTAAPAGWVPRASETLELVADRAGHVVALSSALAPLPADRYPHRVPLGALDSLPFPGTQRIRRCADATVGFAYDRDDPDAGLVGFASDVALNEMVSLYDRWEAGVDELRRRHGVQPRRAHVPDALHGLFLYRSTPPPALPEPTVPTVIVRGAAGDVVGTHLDLLAEAGLAGAPAELGPAVSPEPGAGRRAVAAGTGPGAATIGYGLARGRRGDRWVDLGDGRAWWGAPPPAERVPLFRWRSDGQQRCTTGAPPRAAAGRRGRGRPDTGAELLGVLGWALPAGAEGAALVELFHPRRRQWCYSTDPASAERLGFTAVGVVATLLPVPNQWTVALHRSYDRRTAQYGLHLCPAEAPAPPERLFGFVELAVPGRVLGGELTAPAMAALRTAQRPGDVPVVRMVGAERGDPVITGDVRAGIARGLAADEVVGFVGLGPGPDAGGTGNGRRLRQRARHGAGAAELQLRRAVDAMVRR